MKTPAIVLAVVMLAGCASAKPQTPAASLPPNSFQAVDYNSGAARSDLAWLYCGTWTTPCPTSEKPWWVKAIEVLGMASDAYLTGTAGLPKAK